MFDNLIYLKTNRANINSNYFDGLNALDYSLKFDMNLKHYINLKKIGAKSAKGIIWIIALFLNHLIYKKAGLFKIHTWYHNKYRLDEETKQLLKPTPNTRYSLLAGLWFASVWLFYFNYITTC